MGKERSVTTDAFQALPRSDWRYASDSLFPRLAERCTRLAWSMPYGEQKMLGVERVLFGRSKLPMLDEFSTGLAPIIVEQQSEKIVSIHQLGVTFLLVEQNAAMALAVATRGNLSENPRGVLADTTARVSHHPLFKETCLGS